MDQRTAYELTITEKLRQLPVPDMQDAIWSRIEAQLDIDMPTDDGGGSAGPQSPDWKNLLGRIGPFAVVVAVVTIFLINRSSRKNRPVQQRNQFPTTQTATPSNNPSTAPPGRNRSAPATYPATPNSNPGPAVQSPGDSVSAPPVTFTLPPVGDSVLQSPVLVQTPPPPVKADSVAKKKPRGVTGITDGDYRIVPKKDSI
jgi:hypothetical protein